MKIIFLDMDGVITIPKSNWKPYAPCIDQVHRIEKETGAQIVLSSSWRLLPELRQEILDVGIQFFTWTPLHVTCAPGEELREVEICQWLDKEAHKWGFDKNKDRFVAIDDFPFMKRIKQFAVTTVWDGGLTKEKADEAINILMGV